MAWRDRAGKRSATWLTTKDYTFNSQRLALHDETGLSYLHADHGYYAYGRDRRGTERHTAQCFTGQLTAGKYTYHLLW